MNLKHIRQTITQQKQHIAVAILVTIIGFGAMPHTNADAAFLAEMGINATETENLVMVNSSPAIIEQAVEHTALFPQSQNREPRKTLKFTMTAYNSLVGQTDSTPCITANGYDLCKAYEEQGYGNTVATNDLPFGTIVKIPELFGDKPFVVRDRMNARYTGQHRMDIWMKEYSDARMFGGKYNVEVLVF